MKFLILAVCIYAAQAATFPTKVAASASFQGASVKSSGGSDAEAPILKSVSNVAVDSFNYAYETGNGIAAEADGSLKKVDNQDVIVIKGAYQYVGPDGTPVQVSYVADENGYQPQSDSLPVGPPIPVAIARSLEYIASHPPHVEPEYKRRV